MQRDILKKAKQIDTMLAVLREERNTLVSGDYKHFVISGKGPTDIYTNLAGIDSELMSTIIKWYDDKIQELETEFEAL